LIISIAVSNKINPRYFTLKYKWIILDVIHD